MGCSWIVDMTQTELAGHFARACANVEAKDLVCLAADRLDELNTTGETGTIRLAADLRRLAGTAE